MTPNRHTSASHFEVLNGSDGQGAEDNLGLITGIDMDCPKADNRP